MQQNIIWTIILIGLVSDSLCIVCPENYCSQYQCKEEICGEGQIKTLGTCGCCKVCSTVLEEGKFCGFVGEILSPEPPKAVCAENLICYNNKCQKEKDVVAEIVASNSG
ncbi:fungal protease inhibitor-1 [Leptinotarsa decemlineata]|uniref:fungal protease inhibitor-1 n=1 Tax=Leptinotarsa decemlineata TaxID=7539 RepID=UPI000C2532EE|nr:uncharacterized protein LOC111514729 [Leptinotarsa decemlineata]